MRERATKPWSVLSLCLSFPLWLAGAVVAQPVGEDAEAEESAVGEAAARPRAGAPAGAAKPPAGTAQASARTRRADGGARKQAAEEFGNVRFGVPDGWKVANRTDNFVLLMPEGLAADEKVAIFVFKGRDFEGDFEAGFDKYFDSTITGDTKLDNAGEKKSWDVDGVPFIQRLQLVTTKGGQGQMRIYRAANPTGRFENFAFLAGSPELLTKYQGAWQAFFDDVSFVSVGGAGGTKIAGGKPAPRATGGPKPNAAEAAAADPKHEALMNKQDAVMFGKFDGDGDYKLSKEEVGAWSWGRYDADGDGDVTQREFFTGRKTDRRTAATTADAEEAWTLLDWTADGDLDGTELENGAWLKYDADSDGRVTRAEFMAGRGAGGESAVAARGGDDDDEPAAEEEMAEEPAANAEASPGEPGEGDAEDAEIAAIERKLAERTKQGGKAPPRKPAPRDEPGAGEADGYVMAPDPRLKGRVGRIVIAFPKDGKPDNTRVELYPAGGKEAVKSLYGGNGEVDLISGSYDVVISGKRVSGVKVQAKHSSRIRVGILRMTVDANTRAEILDEDNQTVLASPYGASDVGLPVGKYFVRIAGQSEEVTIDEGQVTEF